MRVEDAINEQLSQLMLIPLAQEQVQCLYDATRLEEAANMLTDLRDRCGLRLPPPNCALLSGPHPDEGGARSAALAHTADYLLVGVDRMATDESRSSGDGDEYYVTGYSGPDAAVALAEQGDLWVACWIRGEQRSFGP